MLNAKSLGDYRHLVWALEKPVIEYRGETVLPVKHSEEGRVVSSETTELRGIRAGRILS